MCKECGFERTSPKLNFIFFVAKLIMGFIYHYLQIDL